MDIPDYIHTIINKFIKAHYQIYLVGGAVRDFLLKRQINDWDLTTDATPEQILELFPEGHYHNQFGTVGIPIDSQVIEVTTMRREGEYGDFRHPGKVEWTKDIKEDLKRRDFTINAMALSPKGELVDLFHGQQDLKEKIIRAVGIPDQRFKEDALRMVKAFRMVSQIDFKIDEETLSSIKKNKELIKNVSGERIRDELLKLLSGDNPYQGFLELHQSGVLEIILPELERCFGIKQEGEKKIRHYDIGEHSLLTLKETPSKDPIVRLASLLHDIGKVDTMKQTPDGNVTFYNHEVVGSRQVLEIAKRLKLSKEQKDKLFRLVRWHLFTVDEHQTDSAIRRFVTNVGRENIKDMYDLRIGDRLGGGTQKAVSWRMDEFFNKRIPGVLVKPFSIKDLKVNGKDVMDILKIPPGPKVGEILQKLFEEVLEDANKNEREFLLNRLIQLA